MTPGFRSRLLEQVHRVRERFPEIALRIENPDALPCPSIGRVPVPFPDPLPEHARISTCEQNPWDTLHVLANGDVVSCEVRERIVLGSLRHQTLEAVWHGKPYQDFRRLYREGNDPYCRSCPWKMAFSPSPIQPAIRPDPWPHQQLLRGWYLVEEERHLWSKPRSLLLISRTPGSKQLILRGTLPPAKGWLPNRLTIRCNGKVLKRVFNISRALKEFEVHADVSRFSDSLLYLDLSTTRAFVPAIEGWGRDIRKLGFALSEARID